MLTSSSLIALYLIVLILFVIIRPIAIKLLYKLLYEPDNRVEDYKITTVFKTENIQDLRLENVKVVDLVLEPKDDEMFNSKMS